MKRYVAESMVIITASIVLVLGTLAMGGTAMRDAAPTPRLPLSMVPGCIDAPVAELDSSGIGGQAQLCVTDEAVRPGLRVANLTPDTAYLALFEYFEQPTTCQAFPCDHADLRFDGSGGTLARMDATIAGGTRQADLWGDFRAVPLTRDSQVTLTLYDRGSVRGENGQKRAHLLLSLPLVLPGSQTGAGGDNGHGRAVARAVFLPSAQDAP
jgi:hypothetical protein